MHTVRKVLSLILFRNLLSALLMALSNIFIFFLSKLDRFNLNLFVLTSICVSISVVYVCNCMGMQEVVSMIPCKVCVSYLLCMGSLFVAFDVSVPVLSCSASLYVVVCISDHHLRWIFINCSLTSLFVSLTVIIIAVHGIVRLNKKTALSGGTRISSL